MFILINSNATGLLTLFYIYIIYIVEYLLDHTAGWAIYSFLSNPNNFWESMFTCLKPGGDTDTVAAAGGRPSTAWKMKNEKSMHTSLTMKIVIMNMPREGGPMMAKRKGTAISKRDMNLNVLVKMS